MKPLCCEHLGHFRRRNSDLDLFVERLNSFKGYASSDLPPTGVPTELRKSGIARLVDLRGG